MKGLSKSKYVLYNQCPKALWLKIYKPEEEIIDENTKARFKTGDKVGDLAMGLFGDFTEVTVKGPEDKLDLEAMIAKTNECLANGTENICEASFGFEGNYCAVDILRKTEGGYAIYEVKSSSDSDTKDKKTKQRYVIDIAYQKWVLERSGITVTGAYLVCLNSDYVLEDKLDLQSLFYIKNMKELVDEAISEVPKKAAEALKVINQATEPDIDLSLRCHKPFDESSDCFFFDYCKRKHGVPLPSKEEEKPRIRSIFELNGTALNFDKKINLYKQGKITPENLKEEKLDKKTKLQVDCTLNDTDYVDKPAIKLFLDKLTYPLYFLDFETMQPAIPEYVGTRPYQQIPFQYSLHYIHKKGDEPQHKEFLAPSDGSDPCRALAEQLCKDVPLDVCTLAYNKSFECTRLEELAEAYSDLKEHLLNIKEHIVDLYVPFRAMSYYVPAMRGSFSIKSVLPALFPGDPELNYHALNGVHNGGEAMTIFPTIKTMPPDLQAKTRLDLLAYCRLDTLAMVKVWERLNEII